MINHTPQIEDGFTKIANEIMEALCCFRIPGGIRQIIDCILRKTYGWNKKEDWIAQSQIVEMTKMSRGNVSRALSDAITHKLVIVYDNKLRLNKNYNEWISFGGKHFNPNPKLSDAIITKAKLSDAIIKKNVIADETNVIADETNVIVSDSDVIVSEGNKIHYTKDTITKDITIPNGIVTPKVDKRIPEINKILEHLKSKMEIPELDLPEKINRRYAHLLLKKSKSGLPGVLWLINMAADNPWFKNHTTSVRDLWNNKIKIISSKRGGVDDGKPRISFIHPS